LELQVSELKVMPLVECILAFIALVEMLGDPFDSFSSLIVSVAERP
jgi:hypothetical protein